MRVPDLVLAKRWSPSWNWFDQEPSFFTHEAISQSYPAAMSIATTSHEHAPSGNFASMLDQLTGLSSNGELPELSELSEFSFGDSATIYQPRSTSREKALKLARDLSSQPGDRSKLGRSPEAKRIAVPERTSPLGGTSKKEPQKGRTSLSSSLPVTSRASKTTSDDQDVKLSYEDALRIHSRRQSPRPTSAQLQSPKTGPVVSRQTSDEKIKSTTPASGQEPHTGRLQAKSPERLQRKTQASTDKIPVSKAKASSNATKGKAQPQRASQDTMRQAATAAKPSYARAAARTETKAAKAILKKSSSKMEQAPNSVAMRARIGKSSKVAPVTDPRPLASPSRSASRTETKNSQRIHSKTLLQPSNGKNTKGASPKSVYGKLRDSSATSVRTRTHTYLARPPKSPDSSEPQIRSLFKSLGLPDRSPCATGTGPSSRETPRSVQRKSMVSMRLNQEEMNSIRIRAEESGVSVCAYIRLCVLEAEQLRAQVKMALSTIRSGVSPEPSNNEQLPKTEQSHSAPLSPWLIRLKGFAAEILFPGVRRSAVNIAPQTSSATL